MQPPPYPSTNETLPKAVVFMPKRVRNFSLLKMEDYFLQLIYKNGVNTIMQLTQIKTLYNCGQTVISTDAGFDSGTNSACMVLVHEALCPDRVVLLPTDSPADHAARHPGPDATQAHPRGRRGHFVLQV